MARGHHGCQEVLSLGVKIPRGTCPARAACFSTTAGDRVRAHRQVFVTNRRHPLRDLEGMDVIEDVLKDVKAVKEAICSALPSGRTGGFSGALGLIGGPVGSVATVTNYDTGEVSLFLSGGGQVGFNGGAQASVFVGLVTGSLGTGNVNYSGPFLTVAGSAALVGLYGHRGGGIRESGVTLGSSLVPVPISGSVGVTVTSKPLATYPIRWVGGADLALYNLRQDCR